MTYFIPPYDHYSANVILFLVVYISYTSRVVTQKYTHSTSGGIKWQPNGGKKRKGLTWF